MVLILSDVFDESTNVVLDHLIRLNKPYLRINTNDKITIRELRLSSKNEQWEISFSINDDSIVYNLNEFTFFWYRKGRFNINSHADFETEKTKFRHHFQQYLHEESLPVSSLLVSQLEKKPFLGNYKWNTPNKLEILEAAQSCGLGIPDTIITSSKRELINFRKSHHDIICKSIQDIISFESGKTKYFTRTELVSDEMVNSLGEFFSPSLFQKKIEKNFEIRSSFFNHHLYSMAIFSQSNDKTKIDFRNYDSKTPNRMVPFTLPFNIERNLINLFNLLKINTGSVDLIYTADGDYIFLEINPIGQFGMLSYHCNYPIEENIAEILSN